MICQLGTGDQNGEYNIFKNSLLVKLDDVKIRDLKKMDGLLMESYQYIWISIYSRWNLIDFDIFSMESYEFSMDFNFLRIEITIGDCISHDISVYIIVISCDHNGLGMCEIPHV